ncbi:MAG: deoxyguanosinetriphosphate triphosphohydrolase, partial [Burkholderiales bacterium]|nr:deoxyguanosinetriphosphate triphosphohydrolase [Burkholderiales bacterium]
VDDGLRSGLLTLEQLAGIRIFSRHMKSALREFPKLNDRRLVHETVRRMIGTLVTDLTRQSTLNIRDRAPADLTAVRSAPPLISFSTKIKLEQQELKQFLRQNLYQHYRVARMSTKARRIVTELFGVFRNDPKLLPPEFQARAREDNARAIADYIAGMTDRYAIREYRRLFAVDAA